MRVTYDISISELKALLELISELCRRNGISETLTKSLMREFNEKHFK